MNADSKIIERIRKLLALASSDNEAEAESAMERAHALLREYNLEVGDIKEPSDIKGHKVAEGGKEMRWRTMLLIAIAQANYCVLITQKGLGMYRHTLYGREHNVAGTMTMYDYLAGVVDRLARRQPSEIVNRNDYRIGLVLGISRRLEMMTAKEAESSTALVPLKTEVDRAVEELCHPKTKNIPIKSSTLTRRGVRDAEGVSLDRQISTARESVRIGAPV